MAATAGSGGVSPGNAGGRSEGGAVPDPAVQGGGGRAPGPSSGTPSGYIEQQLLGQVLGQYEVQSFLGRGGTAMVFRVLDRESGLPRALKMTATDPTDAELHRFKREFRVMSRLAHPNVIAVYRYGLCGRRPYFVMELIEGRDMRSYLRATADRPGYFERVAEVLAQVARALAYIHDRHIVHRDLKPGNILVTHLGLVKVMDFGIAFEVDVTAPPSRARTLMGTLAYVSPEQATGRKVDARADLYSLGIILYELLTGVKPFVGTTLSEVVYKHLHEQPRHPLEIKPELPTALVELALALLAKRPHERPQSAQEVLIALENFITGDVDRLVEVSGADLMPESPPLNEPRFVGREALLERLRHSLVQLRLGQGGIWLVTGESGMGKSRLLEEFCRDEQLEDIGVLFGRCLAQATSPYQGFREPLRQAVSLLAERPGGLQAVLTSTQLAVLAQAFPQLLPLLEPLLPDSAEEVPHALDWLNLFAAVRALLERLTETAPLMLVFDDLDRADEATLALLQALVRTLVTGSAHRHPLTVVGTTRPESVLRSIDPRSGVPLSLSGRLMAVLERIGLPRAPEILSLEPLSLDEVAGMLQSMLGHAEDPDGLAEYLLQQSDGNPYFIEASLQALVEQGILNRREHSVTGCEWTVHLERIEAGTSTVGVAALALPAGLQGALRKRLSLLEPRDLLVLQVAATIGEPFRHDLLREITGIEEDALLDFLDRMLKAHILVERPGDGLANYDFSHARARDLIVGDLSRQEQVLLHQQVGQALARRADESLAATAAHHLYEGRLYDEALPFMLQAGERFVKQQLFRLAMRPLGRAEEILTRYRVPLEGRDDSLLRLQLNHAMGVALRGLGNAEGAFEHLTMALQAVEARQHPGLVAELRTALGHVHRERGEYRLAREHYEAALTALRLAGESHKMGDTILGLGEILSRQGALTHAAQVYREARELAIELQHRPSLAGATLGQGEVALLQGYVLEAQKRLEEALGSFRWLEERPMVVRSLEGLAECQRRLGHFESALEALEEAALIAREYDLRGALAGVRTAQGRVYLDLNAPTQADAVLSEVQIICARNNYIYQRAEGLLVLGMLKALQGQLTAALEAFRQGLKLAQGIAARVLTARLLSQVALLQLQLGESAGAERLIQKSVEDLRACGAGFDVCEAQLVHVQVLLARRDPASAHAAVNEAISLAERLEARALSFRSLAMRLTFPAASSGVSRNAGLVRASALVRWLFEGAGPRWREHLRARADIAEFFRTYPNLSLEPDPD